MDSWILPSQLDETGAEAAAGIEDASLGTERNGQREPVQRAARRGKERRVVPGPYRIGEQQQRERDQPAPRRQHRAESDQR